MLEEMDEVTIALAVRNLLRQHALDRIQPGRRTGEQDRELRTLREQEKTLMGTLTERERAEVRRRFLDASGVSRDPDGGA